MLCLREFSAFYKDCPDYQTQDPPYTWCSHCGLVHDPKEKDPIKENKNFEAYLDPEEIPDPNILNHQKIISKDDNPETEALITKNHLNLHTITETTADHAAIFTLEVPAKVDEIQQTEKDQIY